MAYDKNLLSFFRDEANEVVPLTILGSLRSLQNKKNHPNFLSSHILAHEYQQIEGDNMIDRAATTRDRDRECLSRRYVRNPDVRYISSLRYLRKKLRSSYSCNGRHCPMMKGRLQEHQFELHSSLKRCTQTCDKTEGCSLNKPLMATQPANEELIKVKREAETKNIQTDFEDIINPLTNDNNYCSVNTLSRINRCTSTLSLKPNEIASISVGTNQFNNLKDDNCNYFGLKTKTRADEYKNDGSTNTENITSYSNEFSHIDEQYYTSDVSISLKNNVIKDIMRQNEAPVDNSNVITDEIKSISKSSSTDSEKNAANSNGRKIYTNLIQRGISEWKREITTYSSLRRKDEEENADAINSLMSDLNKLFVEETNTAFEQKARNAIYACLNKLPLCYPAYTLDRSVFINDLCVCLLQNIMNIYKETVRQPADTPCSNSRITKNIATEVTSAVLQSNQTFSSEEVMEMKEIKKNIIEWLWSVYKKTQNNYIVENMLKIADFIIVRVNPLLSKPVSSNNNYKSILQTALVNVINDLQDSIDISYPDNKILQIRQLTEGLVEKLLSVQAQSADCNTKINMTDSSSNYNNYCGFKTSTDNQTDAIINGKLGKCFEDASSDLNDMITEKACVILVDFFEMTDPEKEKRAVYKLVDLLVTSTNHSVAQAIYIIDVVVEKIKHILDKCNIIRETVITKSCNKSQKPLHRRHHWTPSVYTSIEKSSPLNYPSTSTPKKKSVKKMISKLNPQEIQYMEKVASLIRAWMSTLPKSFDAPEEKNFKETMVYDLAGDIMDEAKLKQLTPDIRDRSRHLKYYIARWINRLGVFEDEDVYPQIENLLAKLKEIPVPIMTQPQHGNRQAMANTKYKVDASWHDNFLPKGTDIIEDEISIWMNEQPSNIFIENDKQFNQNKIHELAQVLGNKLKNKSPEMEISSDVAKWLSNIVNPETKSNIDKLTEDLKERVINLPQDATLAAKLDKKLKENAEYKKAKEPRVGQNCGSSTNNVNKSYKNETSDQENSMKMYISKFIEHNYDIDDPLARRAFNRLLKTHLQRINTPVSRKEVYDNLRKNEYDDRFPPQKLIQELEYIKDISDWLKNVPVNAEYNTLGNRDRIDFVNSLAMNIREIEDERQNHPDAMDYESYMGYMILELMHLLPIPEEYLKNVSFMVNQLLTKIITHRQAVAAKLNESTNTTGVNAENFGDFIEEFIRINGDDIAHDEVKLEVWAIRLVREVKKIVQTTSQSSLLSKAHIYNKLGDVPKPGDETADIFSLELDYVKEITNWLKNLPLLPVQPEKDNRTRMICQLAEKITEMERNKSNSPSDMRIDTEFKEYLVEWISTFPLDKKQEIVLPILIEQLMNRIQKVKQKEVLMKLDFSQSSKSLDNTLKVKKKKGSLCPGRGKSKRCQNSSNLMVNAIENIVNKLSFNESLVTEEKDKSNIKEEVSRKLLQKVDQLNIDPKAYNNDLLYQEILTDEVDLIFENLPLKAESQVNKEKLKRDVVYAIIEAKNNIKEKTAGNTYKQKLENMIVASFPNPVSVNHVYEPGLELYKDRLVKLFILENFDHGTDPVKINYEKLLKNEIDRYFDSAKCKNVVPVSKHQLYLELYRNLFKVPIPNEASVIEEVEEIKTYCEIYAWFKELPMREPNGLSELLEWDRILSTLAKRIHEIETSQSPDQRVFKEIMKWLVKLPLRQGNESQHKELAEKLQHRLKSTIGQRKCILDSSKSSKSKKEKTKRNSATKLKEDTEIAEPNDDKTCPVATSSCAQAQQSSVVRIPRKKAIDEIFKIVEAWCEQIPIIANSPNDAQILKSNLITKIIIEIGEINTNLNSFNSDSLYDKLLDEKLETLLSALPTACGFHKSKAARKYQLIQAIKDIKPLILEERANQRYKQELNIHADKILEKQLNMASDKESIFDELRNEIVDDFIQYEYNVNDDEVRQIHKKNIQNNISKLLGNTSSNNNDVKPNLLIKTNQLICELAMVSEKCNANLLNEIEEILMKKELSEFFDEFILPGKSVDKAKVNYLKASLAKKLNEIEISGHTPENESKMKIEIVRCLKKLNVEINHTDIDAFLNKLKNSEMARRKEQTETADDGKGVTNCHMACKRDSHTLAQDMVTSVHGSAPQMPDDISVSFTANAGLASISDQQPIEDQSCNEAEKCCSEITKIALAEAENSENESENEDYDNEDKKRCSRCKKLKGSRRVPYCMVPIRPFCKCFMGYYPYWYRMA